jgi:predicted peroxiredoxin
MKMLLVGTQGSNDPTQAAFPFVFAKGAIEAGHEPTIFLAGEAAHLLKEDVAASTQGVGWPRHSDLWADIAKAMVRVFV